MRSHTFVRWRLRDNLRRLHVPAFLFWLRTLHVTTDREIG